MLGWAHYAVSEKKLSVIAAAMAALVLNLGVHFVNLPLLRAGPVEVLGLIVLFARWLGGPASALVLAAAVWALISAGWRMDDRLPAASHSVDVAVVGTVCSEPRRTASGVQRFEFLTRDESTGLPRRIYVSWYRSDARVRAGDAWRLKLRIKAIRGQRNPGAFDFERWAFERDLGATGYVRASALNRRLDMAGGCRLLATRSAIAQRIDEVLHGTRASAMVIALAVGLRDRMTQADWELLRATGTVHLFAISGLHIGLVAAFAGLAGRALGAAAVMLGARSPPRRCAVGAACLAAVGYAALAGFAVPTLRALLMLLVALLLLLARRRVNPFTLLAGVLFVVLLLQPHATVTVGFWLSFLAVATLLISTQAQSKRPISSPLRAIKMLGLAQVTVMVGLAPMSLMFFERVSLVAPFVNFFVVPLFSFAVVPLILTGVTLLLAGVDPSGVWLQASEWLLRVVLAALEAVAVWPSVEWQPAGSMSINIAAGLVAAVCLLWPRPSRLRPSLALICVALSLRVAPPAPTPLSITVLDVGQGLAVVVRSANYALLYDAGPRFGERDAGETTVVPFLRQVDIARLDAIVLSHPDTDHRGGLGSVLRAYPAPIFATRSTTSKLDNEARVSGATDRCDRGAAWTVDGVDYELWSPLAAHPDGVSENDRSCLLRIRYGAFSMLLTGDIERAAENQLVRTRQIGQPTIVVSPHHGSATSSTAAFVAQLRPKLVIHSAGFANRWRFPADVVVRRWNAVAHCQLLTAEVGAITIDVESGGEVLHISTARGAAGPIWSAPIVPAMPCPGAGALRMNGLRAGRATNCTYARL